MPETGAELQDRDVLFRPRFSLVTPAIPVADLHRYTCRSGPHCYPCKHVAPLPELHMPSPRGSADLDARGPGIMVQGRYRGAGIRLYIVCAHRIGQ